MDSGRVGRPFGARMWSVSVTPGSWTHMHRSVSHPKEHSDEIEALRWAKLTGNTTMLRRWINVISTLIQLLCTTVLGEHIHVYLLWWVGCIIIIQAVQKPGVVWTSFGSVYYTVAQRQKTVKNFLHFVVNVFSYLFHVFWREQYFRLPVVAMVS